MQLMNMVSADPNARTKLTHPYNYDSFTMWRGPGEPDGSVYTDRLFQWDHKKHDALCMKHFGNRGQYWDRRDTDKIQAFLRDYLEAPDLVLCEVQEHCNQATGYPCWSFAYRKTPNVADKLARDKAAMPAACPTPTGCREHGCHGECLPPNAGNEAAPRAAQPGDVR